MIHVQAWVVTQFVRKLESNYGSNDPLSVTSGKVHEYLGMTIDFTQKGSCCMSQFDCIKKLWMSLPDDWKVGKKNTPAPKHLFKVNDEECLLDDARKDDYHTYTAKLLWISQKSRPDIQLATGFHCTRVKAPTEHNWKKLEHLMHYVWATRFLPLIIGIDENGDVLIYIDGAHAVHTDAKGHSGLHLTMGRGSMISVSKKIGLNTNSSTETEVVSTGERMPKCTWFRYFRITQGDVAKEDLLHQDNQSAMILEKNHPFSVGKGSKHIHIRYFFVTDKIAKKEVKLIYCPTKDMIADYNTKPLQGAQFIRFRNLMLGIKAEDFHKYPLIS